MSANRLTAAVIQWRFTWAGADAAWEDQWSAWVGQAAARGARLVALPAHTGDALLARHRPELAHMVLRAGLAHAWHTTLSGAARTHQANWLRQVYVNFCGHLAAQHGIVLAAGSLLLPDEDGELYHQAFVFGVDGAVAGVQRSCHRSPVERALGVAASDRLDVFDTPAGTLGLVVGEDLYYPEVARVLTRQGADLLIAPTQRRYAGEAGLLAGLWRDVQGNQVFGLEVCLVDDDSVPPHSLGSQILCPAELTGDTHGVVASAATGFESEVVVGDLDRTARQQLLARYDIARYANPTFYAAELLRAYP